MIYLTLFEDNILTRKFSAVGSHHFGQVPHLVFAVLDLPSAVVDLLKKKSIQMYVETRDNFCTGYENDCLAYSNLC